MWVGRTSLAPERQVDDAGPDCGELDASEQMAARTAAPRRYFQRGTSAGPATDLEVNRSGQAFNLQGEYQDLARGFLATSGIYTDGEYSLGPYCTRPTSGIRSTAWCRASGWRRIRTWRTTTPETPCIEYLQFDPFLLLPRNMVLAPIVGAELGYGGAAERISDQPRTSVLRRTTWALWRGGSHGRS